LSINQPERQQQNGTADHHRATHASKGHLELREDECDGGGRARGGGGQVDQPAACAPQVGLFGVGCVHEGLRVGEVVDGGDAAVADAQLLVDDLDHCVCTIRVDGWMDGGVGGR